MVAVGDLPCSYDSCSANQPFIIKLACIIISRCLRKCTLIQGGDSVDISVEMPSGS